MARPEFPIGTILTPEAIRAIRENQEYYDKDPARAEREQRQREERRREDEAAEEAWAREHYKDQY